MDDKTKKKLDGKRIALRQKHEVAYLKRIANDLLLETECYVDDLPDSRLIVVSRAKTKRICKALLKFIKYEVKNGKQRRKQ